MNNQIDEIRTEIEREKTARDILGVDYTADETEIKKKYWLLAMETHPDLNPYDRERENRFKMIKTRMTHTMNGVTLNGGK